jgi:hypothetical protein
METCTAYRCKTVPCLFFTSGIHPKQRRTSQIAFDWAGKWAIRDAQIDANGMAQGLQFLTEPAGRETESQMHSHSGWKPPTRFS